MSVEAWISIGLLVNSAIYIFAGRNLIGRHAYDLPRMFWNPTVRLIAVWLPIFGFISVVVTGFAFTAYGWWYLGISVAVFFIFAVRPRYFGQ
jgi:hypothetical protein